MGVENNVTFRRIRGRIVPIRRKEATSKSKLALSGAAHLAGAGAIAYGAGAGVARAVRTASGATMKSRALFKFHRGAMKGLLHAASKQQTRTVAKQVLTHAQGIQKAVRLRKYAAIGFKLRNPALAAGALAAGVLAGAGIFRLSKATSGRKKPLLQNQAVATGSAIAALGTAAVYYKKLPVGGITKVAENAFARVRGLPRPNVATWWRR